MYKIIALLISLIAFTACGNPSLGDRKAALEYVKTYKPDSEKKANMHQLSYFTNWCAEGEKDYWPEVVRFCEPSKSQISESLCSYVNLAEDARIRGKANCDPT